MFQGAMVDVAIGVIVLFLGASLMASAIVEGVGSILHRRSKNLWDTIDLLLGNAKDPEGDGKQLLVDRIYREPFVTKLVQPKAVGYFPTESTDTKRTPGLRSFKPDLTKTERKRRFHGPVHIPAKDFANAFIEAVEPGGIADERIESLKSTINDLPPKISKPLGAALAGAGNNVVAARGAIEKWYEDHMQAVSVWYRRQTRYFLFAAGLGLAVVGNLDAIGATTTLYRDKDVREAVLAKAEAIDASKCSASDEKDPADCLRKELGGAVHLPVGWGDTDGGWGARGLRLLGWLIVAGAVTVGAPFWFDLLRRGLAYRKKNAESG